MLIQENTFENVSKMAVFFLGLNVLSHWGLVTHIYIIDQGNNQMFRIVQNVQIHSNIVEFT